MKEHYDGKIMAGKGWHHAAQLGVASWILHHLSN